MNWANFWRALCRMTDAIREGTVTGATERDRAVMDALVRFREAVEETMRELANALGEEDA